MYYLNLFIIYSMFGFFMESLVYKFKHIPKYSGALYGPITLVYGIGIVVLEYVYRKLIIKIKVNKYLKIIIIFLICSILLTTIEWVVGYLGKLVLNINIWDYSNKKYNIGKYICLELMPIWGMLGTIYLYNIRNFTNKIIKLIPQKIALLSTYLLISDLIATIIKYIK